MYSSPSEPFIILFPIMINISKAPNTANTAIRKGFLSNKIKELKKNKTNDSSWTLINIIQLWNSFEFRLTKSSQFYRNVIRRKTPNDKYWSVWCPTKNTQFEAEPVCEPESSNCSISAVPQSVLQRQEEDKLINKHLIKSWK